MKRASYLNVVLTAIAVLLLAHLWVSVAERPLLSTDAAAQGVQPGIPNAGQQRQEMIRELQALNRQLDRLTDDLGEAKFDVNVVNIKELAQDDGE